jgi:hypothetical protein
VLPHWEDRETGEAQLIPNVSIEGHVDDVVPQPEPVESAPA